MNSLSILLNRKVINHILIVDNGDKLENWTMLELKSKLDEWSLYSKLEGIEDPVEDEEEQKDSPSQENVKKVEITGIYDIPESLITKCSPVSMLGGDLVKIEVVEVIPRVSKGLFKSAQNLYVFNTSPYNWKVEREYKNMILYREIIRKQFPGEVVRIDIEIR